ncbi:MAG: carbohydrate ABC transporter permease [Merdibacter sp.]
MTAICLMVLFPIYYMVIVSISDGTAVMTGQVALTPVGFSLRSYRAAMKDSYFLNSYWNTIVITVSGTLVNLFMTTLFAYPLSRPDFMGRKFLMRCAVFTMFFTGGMIPTYMLVTDLGLGNTYWALILPGAISVYNMIIMRTLFEGIPADLTEAAYIDGNDVRFWLRSSCRCRSRSSGRWCCSTRWDTGMAFSMRCCTFRQEPVSDSDVRAQCGAGRRYAFDAMTTYNS